MKFRGGVLRFRFETATLVHKDSLVMYNKGLTGCGGVAPL